MLKQSLRSIPHSEQRYETVGDWVGSSPEAVDVRVSAMPDWRYEFLVGIHELIEATLCLYRGVSQEAVDAFDKDFERKRTAGNNDEPGDAPDAPYRREHLFATNVERLLAAELGVDWGEYTAAIEAL